MPIGQISQNSAQEFFETFIYGVGYNEGREQIADFTKEVDSPLLKDAIESSMNVLVFGAIMYAVQKANSFNC